MKLPQYRLREQMAKGTFYFKRILSFILIHPALQAFGELSAV